MQQPSRQPKPIYYVNGVVQDPAKTLAAMAGDKLTIYFPASYIGRLVSLEVTQ